MKQHATLVILSVLVVSIGATGFSLMSTSGAPGGYTGSPGDGHDCSHCMGGTVINVSGWITSTIPTAGYTPGTTYEITMTNNLGGTGKFGFLCAPQTLSGSLVGSLTAVPGITQLMDNQTYVTHWWADYSTHSWYFNWTAPAAGTGAVTFYAAFARGNAGLVGLTTYVVNENFSGIPGQDGPATVVLGPNPARDAIILKNLPGQGEKPMIHILDSGGKLVKAAIPSDFSGMTCSISTSGLRTGLYLVEYQSNTQHSIFKVLVL